MKKNILIGIMFILLFNTSLYAFISSGVNVIEAIVKHSKALPDSEVIKLSKLSDEKIGTKKVGKYLGAKKLPNEVLEDTYVRIAIHQKKITRVEAEEFYKHLSGVDGFRTTLRKTIGNSSQKTAGHLNELKIANSAAKNNFKVLGIGEKYKDGLKQASTDIDIVLKKDNKTFIIEAKDYQITTKLPMIKYRADLATLSAYKLEHKNATVVPIFSITNKPMDKKYLKLLKKEAKRRNIELIFGTPSQQMVQINQLNRIIK